MKNAFLILLMFNSLSIILHADDKLDIKEKTLKSSTVYELQLHTKEKIDSIWSREVPFVDGEKPGEECFIWTWKKTDRGMIVVVTFNGFEGRFLQFDTNQKLIAELFLGSYWFDEMANGAKIKLEPPDKIKLDNNGKIIKDLTIRNGKFFDANGKEWGKVQYIKVNPGLSPDK